MKSLLIKNAKIWDIESDSFIYRDILCKKKKIDKIGRNLSADNNMTIIDAEEKLLIPGLIDIGVRLREPGQTYKATIATESKAAAANGITTLVSTPDTTPTIDDPSVVELVHQKAIKARGSQVLTSGALTKGLQGKQLSKMGALRDAGCIAFNQMDFPIANSQTLRRALEYASSLGMTVLVQPLDQSLAVGGCIHEGRVATRLGLKGIPDVAETVSLLQWLTIAEYTRTPIHFSHLSCKESVELIKQAKQKGLPVTADVTINHLFLTEMDCATFNSHTHIKPPLRTMRDRDQLRQALKEGVIDFVCSDHQPHDIDAKLAPFQDSEPGISGIDLFLPLCLKLMEENVLDMNSFIRSTSQAPACLCGLNAGEIKTDYLANFTIVDENKEFEVEAQNFKSSGKNTPYSGWLLKGKVKASILRGKVIYQ